MLNEEIEKLRAIPILRLMGKPIGKRVSVRCPFHTEKTPSCVIYPNNSFHCFGCQKHGHGAISFLIEMGVSFQDACEELKKYL